MSQLAEDATTSTGKLLIAYVNKKYNSTNKNQFNTSHDNKIKLERGKKIWVELFSINKVVP